MKIPLSFLDEKLWVTASFNAPHYHGRVQLVDFVVDTGTNISMVGYGDAIRMSLPVQSLHVKEPTAIGGVEVEARVLKNVKLGFRDEDGGFKRFELPEFFVMFPLTKKREKLEESKTIPSLLGLDFMRSHKLSLFCNPSKELAYFED
jgi:hypothetical protein